MLSHHTHSELDARAFMEANNKLKAFVEECVLPSGIRIQQVLWCPYARCILPVAIQAEALVLVHTSACHLSYAFNEIVRDYARTVSGALPFTVVHIAVASWCARAWAVSTAASAPDLLSSGVRPLCPATSTTRKQNRLSTQKVGWPKFRV